jgi:hypothetical protein
MADHCDKVFSMYSCPICHIALKSIDRYPRYVCRACAAKAVSPDGRLVKFSEEGVGGGLAAEYADTHETYNSDACFIDGIKCHADVARFGGIVIQTIDAAKE